MTRFLEWLEMHDDVPFFAFLHFFDPHGPREPYPPYDTMWAAPSARGEQEMRWQKLEKAGVHAPYIQNEERSDRVPAVALLQKAEVDPEAFIAHEFAWYDGSIRAMDVEIGRLLEGLEARGLADKTLVAFVSDHGEEFLDHGYLGHGHTAYGELPKYSVAAMVAGRWAGRIANRGNRRINRFNAHAPRPERSCNRGGHSRPELGAVSGPSRLTVSLRLGEAGGVQ